MKDKILIVEDQYVEANYLKLMLEKASYSVQGIARSVAQANELIKAEKPGFVLLDIFLKGKQTGIDLAKQLAEDGVPFVYLSANSNEEVLNAAKETQPYGFLVKPFRERDLMVTLEIAQYRHQQSLDSKYHREKTLRKSLREISIEPGEWNHKILKTVQALQQFIPFDCAVIKFKGEQSRNFSGIAFLRIAFDEYQVIGIAELSMITGLSQKDIISLLEATPVDEETGCYNGEQLASRFKQHPMKELFARTFQFHSNLVIPFRSGDGYNFSLSFFRKSADGYHTEQLEWFSHVEKELIEVVNGISGEEKLRATTMKHQAVKTAYEKTSGSILEGIIGKAGVLLAVKDLVNQVSAVDTSVLILGESGTGKERIAHSIHELSGRKAKAFVKVNCAALPSSLIESELFGHEKGAFTGAHERRIGKFEQANGGSIFLDEIGEMPLELQVKLLRVLQEKEIERVGGVDTIKINVRIIAATNRNLEKEVAAGRFRLDLYYRLNVFPITLPTLAERIEDIPELAYHFLEIYGRKAGKKMTRISTSAINSLMSYHWPGNIRELEHLIERSVLLARGSSIEEVALPKAMKPSVPEFSEGRMKTIHEHERDYIITVLKKCKGRIWGPGAAAEILNIPPSTLQSKMKKLGIRKEFIE